MDWEPRPGMLVVCVDDANQNYLGIMEIVAGHTYTVRAVTPPDELLAHCFNRPLDEPGVLLVEVRRLSEPELGEMPFGANRFRPLDADSIAVVRREQVPA